MQLLELDFIPVEPPGSERSERALVSQCSNGLAVSWRNRSFPTAFALADIFGGRQRLFIVVVRKMRRAVPGQRPVVLVVEDEGLIRMNAITIVEEAGFEAISASDADEAIRILESRNDIRAIFTDVHMPGSMGRN